MRSLVGVALFVAFVFGAGAQVSYERVLDGELDKGHWLTYSGNYAGFRYSPLDEITASNVKDLRVAWIYQLPDGGHVETSPIVVDGVMYITEPPGTVSALDIQSGRRLWRWTRPDQDRTKTIGFPKVNRGVAVLGDTVYVGTLDCYLVALDARSGAKRWEAQVAENRTGHSITVAPLALDGKIIIGVSGGEAGIRGFLDAYDASNGERLWRFYTIPGPGEPGNDTWGGDSWKTGAGPTWITGVFDPDLNTLYWGVGNPGPDWNGDVRPGDNLYTSSVVALNPDTGTLKWHFQYTPHDTHDWDANQVPILVDADWEGKPRKLLTTANRNGFYYVLDRETGEFLHGTPYAKQTWAEGLDENGRPIVIPGTEPTEEGNLVWPSLQGATNWFSPSYSPASKLFYVSVREMGAYYFKSDVEYEEGAPFMGGGERALKGDDAYGALRALDVLTGERKWEFRLQSPPWSGVLSTAGGLVFGGSMEGNFYALDAESGEPLWDIQTGGSIAANPIAFAVGDRQHIAIAAGTAILTFALP